MSGSFLDVIQITTGKGEISSISPLLIFFLAQSSMLRTVREPLLLLFCSWPGILRPGSSQGEKADFWFVRWPYVLGLIEPQRTKGRFCTGCILYCAITPRNQYHLTLQKRLAYSVQTLKDFRFGFWLCWVSGSVWMGFWRNSQGRGPGWEQARGHSEPVLHGNEPMEKFTTKGMGWCPPWPPRLCPASGSLWEPLIQRGHMCPWDKNLRGLFVK